MLNILNLWFVRTSNLTLARTTFSLCFFSEITANTLFAGSKSVHKEGEFSILPVHPISGRHVWAMVDHRLVQLPTKFHTSRLHHPPCL